MHRFRLAERNLLIAVARVAAVMGVRRERADVALLDLARHADLGEDRILRRHRAKIERQRRFEVAAGVPHRPDRFLDDLFPRHARSRHFVNSLDRRVEDPVGLVDHRVLFRALDRPHVGEDIRHVDDLGAGKRGLKPAVKAIVDPARESDRALLQMQLFQFLDHGRCVRARFHIAHPVLRVEQHARRDVDQMAPVDDDRQRLIVGRKNSEKLAFDAVAQVEKIAAGDDGAIGALLAQALPDTGISPVALSNGQRRSILYITSHDRPP